MDEEATAAELLIADRYAMLGLLGSGGMGAVYRVFDRELEEEVALKMFRQDMATVPGMLERFRQEVKLARRVTHPNVARTFDIGRHGNDFFLTMEYVRGRSLGDTLRSDGPPELARVVDVMTQLCAGVAAAHEVGVVHRDLKPANVMLATCGRVVITDFGIARLGEEGDGTQSVVGTPAYMAPEQVSDPASVGPAADLYALGAIFFELLTGRRAWTGPYLATLAKRLESGPPDPRDFRRDLPPALAEAAMRAMARIASDRFPTPMAFAEHIADLSVPRIAPPARPARSVEPPNIRTIVMHPIENAGPREDDYLAAGLTDDLAEALASTPSLRVARSRDHAADLRVLAVLRARMFRVADSVRISGSLVSVEKELPLWSTRITTPFVDLLKTTDAIAAQIAGALTVEPPEQARGAPLDPVALDLYLRARSKYHTDFMVTKEAPKLFEQALARAPDNPTILAGYAMSLTRSGGPFAPSGAKLTLARDIAERAVMRAPHAPDARVALARVRLDEGRPLDAAIELRVALAAGQTSADVLVTCGWLLNEVGDLDGAITRLRIAKRLDPEQQLPVIEMTRALAMLGHWEEVESALAQAATVPCLEYPAALQRIRLLAGWRRDHARAEDLLRELEAKPDLYALPGIRAGLETVLTGVMSPKARSGLAEAARAASGAPRRVAFVMQVLAENCAFIGDHEGALDAIMQADSYRLFDLAWVDRCPVLADVRDDARFVAVRERVAARVAGVVEALAG